MTTANELGSEARAEILGLLRDTQLTPQEKGDRLFTLNAFRELCLSIQAEEAPDLDPNVLHALTQHGSFALQCLDGFHLLATNPNDFIRVAVGTADTFGDLLARATASLEPPESAPGRPRRESR